jgi:NAD(P)-dependent dehydrogenase (short-subunit alcohol dehydrogenase family)
MTELIDRVVLITGAAGGIGSATARALVGAGAHVVLHDLDAAGPVRKLADEIGDRA